MPSTYSAADAIDSNDEGHSEPPLESGLSLAQGTSTVTSSATDRPNVWKRCPLPHNGDKIRLLKLYPPSKCSDDILEAKLIVRNDDEPYEALSYTWGFKGHSSSIRICSGVGKFEEFDIQANLESALRQLRRAHSYRLLWADAICIDQENPEEKNHQVAKMAEIYNNAENVCVWLGEGGESTERGLSFISRILDLNSFDCLVADQNSVQEWHALLELMNSPWFSRRWIIQEVALARQATVHCGKARPVQWMDFANAVALFGSRYHQIQELFRVSVNSDHQYYLGDLTALAAHRLVDELSNLFRKIHEYRYSLEHLVSSLSLFQATDPRDIIYAVLSLAEDTGAVFSVRPSRHILVDARNAGENPQALSEKEKKGWQNVPSFRRKQEKPYPVDYEKSFLEVCKGFLEFAVERSQNLDMICRPWAPVPLSTEEELPFWIPTVRGAAYRSDIENKSHDRLNADNLAGIPTMGKRNYNAARKYPLEQKWRIGKSGTPEDKSLFVSGFILGSITRVASPAHGGAIPLSWVELAGWKTKNGAGLPPNAFWRTIVADGGLHGGYPPPYYQFARQHAFFGRAAEADINTELLSTPNKLSSELTEFLRRAQTVICSRVLMQAIIGDTDKNLGLAPKLVREGDLICILYGVSVPVVLRKFSDNKEKDMKCYILIGECYVHGMMDGEAFRTIQEMNIKKEEFELR
jgi:hypothetical protein